MNTLFGDIAQVTTGTVTLTDGRTAHFDPADKRAPALASVLEDLREQRHPVCLELDPATGFIARTHIPLLARVESIAEGPSGDFEVRLFRSHARHTVRRENVDVLRTLRAAPGEQWLAVTVADDGTILDARPYAGPGKRL